MQLELLVFSFSYFLYDFLPIFLFVYCFNFMYFLGCLQVTYLLLGYLYLPCKFWIIELIWSCSLCLFFIMWFLFWILNFRPTFRRIIRNGSTEMFSGLPYIYSLMNCLICLWYGTPLISHDNILVTTVNSIGAVFQFVYIILFMMCAEKEKKVGFGGL